MSFQRVLLFGAHGKIAMHLTPMLAAKSWHVTGVVRNPDHQADIIKLSDGKPGKVDVVVESLEDMEGEPAVKNLLEQVQPSIVVWSAGAGGKGDPSRVFAVDRDAAKYVISASLSHPSVQKFMMVSYIGSTRVRAPWWTDEDWVAMQKLNHETLPKYAQAKIEADEHLSTVWKRHPTVQVINLRPGTLTDSPGTGCVQLGPISPRGTVSRTDVAAVAAELLSRDDTAGYWDLLQGPETIEDAVARCVARGHARHAHYQ